MTPPPPPPPPHISVIIPHLNQPEFLRRCLTSLAGQSFDAERFEVIVVDNGSASMPDDICAQFTRIQLDRETTPGPGPARNHGTQLAQGSVLAFIDADCIADPEWLTVIATTLEDDKATGIIGGDVRIAIADPDRLTPLEAYESLYAYRQKDYIERQGFSGTGNLAMRSTVFGKVGAFLGIDVAEDREWGQRATSAGHRISYVPQMIVFHPARKTFAELCAKWDRQAAHDHAQKARGVAGKIRWIGLTVAVAGSPVIEIFRIIKSPRLTGTRTKILAAVTLTRIRLYRAFRMAELLIRGQKAARSGAWNRD